MKLTGGPRETAVIDCVIVAYMSTYKKFHFNPCLSPPVLRPGMLL
jgi:hypothetical protein